MNRELVEAKKAVETFARCDKGFDENLSRIHPAPQPDKDLMALANDLHKLARGIGTEEKVWLWTLDRGSVIVAAGLATILACMRLWTPDRIQATLHYWNIAVSSAPAVVR